MIRQGLAVSALALAALTLPAAAHAACSVLNPQVRSYGPLQQDRLPIDIVFEVNVPSAARQVGYVFTIQYVALMPTGQALSTPGSVAGHVTVPAGEVSATVRPTMIVRAGATVQQITSIEVATTATCNML